MRTEHLFVLILTRNESDFGTVKHVSALQYFLTDHPSRCFFCVPFLLFVFHFCQSY